MESCTKREAEQDPHGHFSAWDMKVPLMGNLTPANIQGTDFDFLLTLIFCDL